MSVICMIQMGRLERMDGRVAGEALVPQPTKDILTCNAAMLMLYRVLQRDTERVPEGGCRILLCLGQTLVGYKLSDLRATCRSTAG